MLKIKDNVDLKELEKFGFEYSKTLVRNEFLQKVEFSGYYKNCIVIEFEYMIDENSRLIIEPVFELDTIYDLIKAELVEKISEGYNE